MIKNKQKGMFSVGALILIILTIFIASKVNFKKILDPKEFDNNSAYLEKKVEDLWQQYLSKPTLYIWNNMFGNLVTTGVTQLKTGNLDFNAPVIDTSKIDKAVGGDNIRNYFNSPTEETVNSFSTPISEPISQ